MADIVLASDRAPIRSRPGTTRSVPPLDTLRPESRIPWPGDAQGVISMSPESQPRHGSTASLMASTHPRPVVHLVSTRPGICKHGCQARPQRGGQSQRGPSPVRGRKQVGCWAGRTVTGPDLWVDGRIWREDEMLMGLAGLAWLVGLQVSAKRPRACRTPGGRSCLFPGWCFSCRAQPRRP
jgi:hypothetical protein